MLWGIFFVQENYVMVELGKLIKDFSLDIAYMPEDGEKERLRLRKSTDPGCRLPAILRVLSLHAFSL